MKIALFSSTLDVKNGYGNITYELCKALVAKNIDFELFLPKHEEGKFALEINFPVHYVLPEYIFRIKTPKALPYFFQDIDVSKFDLVHSLFDFPYAFMIARLARKYRKPFLMGSQGTYGVAPLTYFPEKYMLKWAYRQAKEIMVPSTFTKSKILEYAHTTYPISIIHNGVNFSRFNQDVDESSIRAKYPGKKILITVGGPKKRKGQDIVIRAMPKVIAEYPDVVYLVIGGQPTGDDRKNMIELAQGLGVGEQVVFTGQVNDEDIIKYFRACDVYVHTPRVSNLNFEGFGIVYIEAGACGKPSVATDSGGIRDAVVENKTGLIAPDEDSDTVARHIVTLLKDDTLRSQMGERAKEYAREHDWSIIAEQYIERYKKYS